MAVESKSFPVAATPLPAVTVRVQTAGIQDTYRRQFTWAQVIIVFLFVECAVWAARLSVRSRWALATGAIVVVFALVDRPSLRRLGLAGTEWAEAQADTIRLKLLKIAAQVRITARRIWVRYSCAYPWQNVFATAWTALRC